MMLRDFGDINSDVNNFILADQISGVLVLGCEILQALDCFFYL